MSSKNTRSLLFMGSGSQECGRGGGDSALQLPFWEKIFQWDTLFWLGWMRDTVSTDANCILLLHRRIIKWLMKLGRLEMRGMFG